MHDFEMAQLVILLCALIQAPLKALLKVGDTPMIPLAKGYSQADGKLPPEQRQSPRV